MKQPVLYLLLSINLLFFANAYSQSWLWATQPVFTGNPPTQSDGEGYSVATDNQGNVYETGFFAYASLTYGSQVLSSISGTTFLVKYNSAGAVQWAAQSTLKNLSSTCQGYFVTTDVSGNVYVTGFFNDTVNFGGIMLTSTNGGEVFLAKYSSSGNIVWVRQSTKSAFNGNYNFGLGISTDLSGNVYVTGQFENTTTFGSYSLTNPSGAPNQYYMEGNVFLVKYDSLGNVKWAKQGTLPSNASFASARAVCTDASGNIFITGAFHDSISFGSQMLTTKSIVGEIFTVKYDPTGTVLWARQSVNRSTDFWSNGPIFGNALATDKSGSVYVAGNFEDTIYFAGTELIGPIDFAQYAFPYGDMFIAKYDANGNLDWAKAAYPLVNATFAAWGIAADTFNHIYCITGGWNVYSSAKLTFEIQFGGSTFTMAGSPSSESSWLLELDTAGNALCGSMTSVGGDENTGIAVDPTGTYVYEGSDFIAQNNVAIGRDTLSIEGNPINSGVEIPFILRWQPCVVATPLSVSFIDTNASCNGLCNGKAIANPSGGTPPYTYSWNNSPADTLSTITGLCAGQYHVTVTDKTGSTITSGTTITGLTSPVLVISAALDTACAGDTVYLFVGGTNGGIQWQSSATGNNFADIPGADSPSLSKPLQQTTNYRVINSNGSCADTSSPLMVVALPLPSTPVLTAGDTLICIGDSTQICASGNYATYYWSTGATNSCIEAQNAGGYWVTVTSADGCSVVSRHKEISVYPVPPTVSIVEQGDTLSSFGANSYQWYLNNAPIANATGPVYVVSQSGNYAIEITDTNGCRALSNSVYIQVTGIPALEISGGLDIYPNPFNSSIFIKLNNRAENVIGIEVLNVLGEVVISREITGLPQNLMTVDVSLLPVGAYYLRVKTADGDFIKEMIKE